MNILKTLKKAAVKEVIGSTLKAGAAPPPKGTGWKAKAIAALTVIVAAASAALSYLQS
jgi:hypothetical protein